MSFKAKLHEWKRTLARLLVLGLVITSVPSTPVYAAEDVTYISEDVSGQVVESAENAAMQEVVEETTEEVVEEVVEETTEEVVEETAEETTEEVVEEVMEETTEEVTEEITEDIVTNVEGLLSGVSGENEALSSLVAEMEDVTTITVGETLSGFAGLENYMAADGYCFKVDLTETGRYRIDISAEGIIRVVMPDGGQNSSYYTQYMNFDVMEAGEYYFYVSSGANFDVTLSKVPNISEMHAFVERDEFYYEIENVSEYMVIDYIQIITEDGTEEISTVYDDVWYNYGLSSDILDENGNIAQLDNNYQYPVGKYTCRYYQESAGVYCEIPIEIVSIDNLAQELTVGGTISGLSGTDEYSAHTYENGHWIKFELTEAGSYLLDTCDIGSFLLHTDSWTLYGGGDTIFEATEPGTYYCYMKGDEVFDVTLIKRYVVTEIDTSLICDTFYYGVEDINLDLQSIRIIGENEDEVLDILPYDLMWNFYEFTWDLFDADGNYASRDENYNYPVGNYVYKLFQGSSDVCCEIPIQILSVEDVSTEMNVGDTLSNLLGTENYSEYNYTGGYWLKLNLTEKRNYTLSKTTDGLVYIMYPEGFGYWCDDMTQVPIETTEVGYHYCYVKGSEDFEVSLTQEPIIESLQASASRDEFYYEAESMQFDGIENIKFTLDNGEEVECSMWDEVWFDYDFNVALYNSEGSIADWDDNGKYPVGDYVFRLIQGTSDVYLDIPVKVVSVKDVATELKVGETLSGLSGAEEYDVYSFKNGHWIKFEISEERFHTIAMNTSGSMYMIDPVGYSSWYFDDMNTIAVGVSEPGYYYCYVKSSEDFDASLTQEPIITSIQASISRDEYYYERGDLYYDIDHITFTLDNGEEFECNMWDSTWNYYGFGVDIYDSEGNVAQQDENGKYPVGDYVFKFTQYTSDVYLDTPVKVVSIEETALELKAGETITGLSGTDGYNEYECVNGHWLRLDLTESGRYLLEKTSEGMLMLCYADGSEDGYSSTTSRYIDVEKATTCYCYVKGNEEFDVTLTRIPTITEIQADHKETIYYEMDGTYSTNIGYLVETVHITLDDGTNLTCNLWDDIWFEYNLKGKFTDTKGMYVSLDANYKYPVGDYIYTIYNSDSEVICELPVKIVSIFDESVELDIMPTEAVPVADIIEPGVYKIEVEKEGIYELVLSDDTSSNYRFYLYDANANLLRSDVLMFKRTYSIGTLPAGDYYISIYTYAPDSSEDATLQLVKVKALTSLSYTGSTLAFQYGEWGYKVGSGPSSNYVSTSPMKPNTEVSGNRLSLPMSVTGTLEDGSTVDILINGSIYRTYACSYRLYNADGSTVYADANGYLADGNYILRITAFGGVSVDVPVQVVGGPIELTQLTYAGGVQSFAYGTWGYSTKQLASGNQLDDPRAANSDMNKVLSGNNFVAIDFTLNGKGENGEETEISYRSKEWNLYGMKNYFYDAEGNSILTDADGYITVGTYTLKCVAKNGVVCEIPFEVYLDEELITEKELKNAVEDILEAGEALSDKSLQNASDAEKQAAVEQVLEKVDEISASQDIAEIGAASAEDAIEFTSKLTVLEEQIESLLGTSVEVVPQDTKAENMGLEVKNALLSVPAGENAEIKVTTVEVPSGTPVDKQAIAIKVQLIAENDAKLQLQAPVIITMNVPEGINKEKEIVVYHYSDALGLVETIPVVLNGDGTVSFAIGSFSTLVLANASVAVTSVTLDKSSVSLNTKESITLTATVAPSDASNKEVLWKSDNTAVATVDSTGKVTAVAAGTATITATAVGGSNIFATCKVTVTEPVVVDKVEAFVTRMYQQCLSRNPDKAGLEGWVGQLKGGYMNGAQIAEQFVFSNEMLTKNLSNKEFVKVLYRAMMGREADEAGLAGWVDQLDKRYMTRSQVTKSFVESKEFTNICTSYGITRGTYNASTAPIEQFVTRFYTLCLERTPDQAGLYGWVGNLKNKYMNGAQIADSFFFSKEFVNKNVSDEKYIELLYNTLMGRPSDESGKAGWMRQLANGWMTRKDMMKSFIESKEFTGICETYGINRGSL